MTNRRRDQRTKGQPLRGIVFDLDGTLLNCPYDFAEMRRAVLGLAAAAGLQTAKLAGLGVLEAIAAAERLLDGDAGRRFRSDADEAVLRVELAGAERSAALPGAGEVLRWLRAEGLRTAIITRNSAAIVDTLLRRVAFEYDALLPRESVAHVKPHPEHLQAALLRLECRPEHALMVGDHVWDMACGRAAGVVSVGVMTGASTREGLLAAGAVAVIEGVAELPTWLSARHALPVGDAGL